MTKPLSPAMIAVVKATESALVVYGLAITSRMYELLFANAEIAAIKEVLGDAVDDATLAAWGEAYWFLADVLIARESMEDAR
jgi:hemoglobin-like flavoprotein